ncbi:hypothetical protein O1611_g2662 [Lasiodiplodia mahajangana]|uniref:Uncharacterized protein n=1 Tax=Lasiodiplodia mahajangana TaxID=1108764 RepID=A0ACC2JU86_9PEZI|nr:hypothetical protein O1611_g2662 [Lasiodiplodia mahajangana]
MTTVNKSAPDTSYRKPKTRQRVQKEPPALAVPDINDDAAERERKRQAKSHRHGAAENAPLTPQSDTQDNESGSPMRQDTEVSTAPIPGNEALFSAYPSFLQAPDSAHASLDLVSNIWLAAPLDTIGASLLPEIEGPYPDAEVNSLPTMQPEALEIGAEPNALDSPHTIDPSALLNSLSSSPSASNESETTEISFPDSYYLPVNELTILRGLMRIALRLRCNTTTIWDLRANSPFNDGTHTELTAQELPPVWRPTLSQSSIAHHPVIDLLPWPNVRDRIIMLMSLPDEARPPAAAGPLAIAQLAYDLEDAAEGARIWGDDPCEPTSWEIGQVLFERWWFVFDRQVIEQSNYWRKLRGAAVLSPKG